MNEGKDKKLKELDKKLSKMADSNIKESLQKDLAQKKKTVVLK